MFVHFACGEGFNGQPLDGQGFEGHPFDGQGWPSKPPLHFYKNVCCLRLDMSPMIERVAFEPPTLRHQSIANSDCSPTPSLARSFEGHPLDGRGFVGHPWPSRGWPSKPPLHFYKNVCCLRLDMSPMIEGVSVVGIFSLTLFAFCRN